MVLAGAMWVADRPKPTERDGTPIEIDADPLQQDLPPLSPEILERGGQRWLMTSLARFVGRGVVLSRRSYRFEREGELAPVDVAIAWGPLVRDRLHEKLSWSQSNRWYWWKYGADFAYPDAFVARHSANIHVIPATENLRRAALALRPGNRVELSGNLVRVENVPGRPPYSWVSSLSREDEGNGSCEVLYLIHLKTGIHVYR